MSIAVIVPTYNREHLLKRTLASIQRQQCSMPLSIIVVDDGSTDNTLNLLNAIASSDHRVTIIQQENRGASAARNAGIEALPNETKYVAFLDSDDVMIDGRLASSIQHLEQDPALGYVINETVVVDNFPADQLEPDENTHMVRVVTHSATSAVYRADVFKKVGLFNTNLAIAEDLDLFLRLAEARVPFKQTDEPHFYYIKHEGEHLTKNQKLMTQCFAKAVAMSLSRRKNKATPLLMPKFNTEALNKLG